MKRTILAALFAVCVTAGAQAAPLTFALVPASGTVSGIAGTVVGWGYNITNSDPSNFVVLNDSFVTGSLASGTFGHYIDYVASNFIVINPSSSTGPVNFIPSTSGTGEFDIAKFVPAMPINGGISIDYSLFSQDPNSPTFDPGSFVGSGTVSASAQVDVVPEPATALFMITAILPFAVVVCRRRSKLAKTA